MNRPLLNLICLVVGAATNPASSQNIGRRDSAGVVIVLNGSIEKAPTAFRLESRPTEDFGGLHDDPKYELSPLAILDIYRLPNGDRAILNGQEVRTYSRSGVFKRVIGRGGQGPDEFSSPIREFCEAGRDTVVIVEGTAPRIGTVDLKQGTLRIWTYQGMISYNGCLGSGLMVAQLPATSTKPVVSQTATFGIINSSGTLVRVLGILPVSDYTTIYPREVSVVARNGSIYVSDGLRFEYRIYDDRGRLQRIVRTADQARPFSRQDAVAVVQARLPSTLSKKAKDDILRDTRNVPVPSTWPTYTRLLVDELGRVWLSDPPKDPKRVAMWTVFDSAGKLLGRVDPASSALFKNTSKARVVRWGAVDATVMYVDNEGAPHVALVALKHAGGRTSN